MVMMPLPAPCSTVKTVPAGTPTARKTTAPTACATDATRADQSGLTLRSKLYSSNRPATCAGPTNDANAIAAPRPTPLACSTAGRCAAIAVLTNQVAPKTKASSQAVERFAGASVAAATSGAMAAAMAGPSAVSVPRVACKPPA